MSRGAARRAFPEATFSLLRQAAVPEASIGFVCGGTDSMKVSTISRISGLPSFSPELLGSASATIIPLQLNPAEAA